MIDKFAGKYRFLSNFYVEPDGTCVELEYQSAKCCTDEDREKFNGLTAGQAKRLGKTVKLRPDWEDLKQLVMFNLVYSKFEDHKELTDLLTATGTQELIEGNDWGDRYWGVCRGKGENELGKILMLVRDLINTEAGQ